MRVHGRHFFLILAILAFISIPIATSFSQTPPLRFAKPLLYGWEMDGFAVADLNGDGYLDLTGPWDQGNVGVLLGKGNGTFRRVIKYPSGGNSPFSVAIADVNGDGKPDIVGLNIGPGTGVAGVLLGNGDGSFQLPVTYSTGSVYGSRGLAVGDLNGDGYPDIVVMSGLCSWLCPFQFGLCGCVDVLYNNRNGTFGAGSFQLSGGYSLNAVSIANGFLISTNSCLDPYCDTSWGTVCCEGNCYNSGGEDPFSPAATGDLNGDGYFDIAVANYTGGNVGVLLGSGHSNFLPVRSYSAGKPYDVAVGDVNGDGKPDVVVSNRRYSTGVLLGNGDGTFQTMVNFGWVGDILVLGDLNDDGKLDLIGSEGVMLNTSGFSTATHITSSLNPSFVNQSVTFTATVTSTHGPIPDGEFVTFYSGTKLLASVPLSGGTAAYTTSTLTVETHIMKAKYPGDITFQSSIGKIQQVVQ